MLCQRMSKTARAASPSSFGVGPRTSSRRLEVPPCSQITLEVMVTLCILTTEVVLVGEITITTIAVMTTIAIQLDVTIAILADAMTVTIATDIMTTVTAITDITITRSTGVGAAAGIEATKMGVVTAAVDARTGIRDD